MKTTLVYFAAFILVASAFSWDKKKSDADYEKCMKEAGQFAETDLQAFQTACQWGDKMSQAALLSKAEKLVDEGVEYAEELVEKMTKAQKKMVGGMADKGMSFGIGLLAKAINGKRNIVMSQK